MLFFRLRFMLRNRDVMMEKKNIIVMIKFI